MMVSVEVAWTVLMTAAKTDIMLVERSVGRTVVPKVSMAGWKVGSTAELKVP